MATGFYWDERCFWHGGGNYAGMLPVGGLVQPAAHFLHRDAGRYGYGGDALLLPADDALRRLYQVGPEIPVGYHDDRRHFRMSLCV